MALHCPIQAVWPSIHREALEGNPLTYFIVYTAEC